MDLMTFPTAKAPVAQSAVHSAVNRRVVGSSPTGSDFFSFYFFLFFFCFLFGESNKLELKHQETGNNPPC